MRNVPIFFCFKDINFHFGVSSLKKVRNAQFFCFRDIHFHFVVPSLKKSEKCAIFFVLRAYTPATPVTTQDFKDPNFRLPQPLLKKPKTIYKKIFGFFYFFVLWLNLRCPRNSKFCYKVTAHSFIIQKIHGQSMYPPSFLPSSVGSRVISDISGRHI